MSTQYFIDFEKNIENIVNSPKTQYLYKLLYSNVITLMETYLYELFINGVREHNLYDKVVKNRKFQSHKISLNSKDIELNNFDIKKYIETNLIQAMIFHSPTSFFIIKEVFDIEINLTDKITKAIDIRHDIIHRNGKDFNNQNIEISEEYLNELIEEVRTFLTNIDRNFIDKYAVL